MFQIFFITFVITLKSKIMTTEQILKAIETLNEVVKTNGGGVATEPALKKIAELIKQL